MKNAVRRCLSVVLAAWLLPAGAGELPAAADLGHDARRLKDGVVLVLFSLPGCRYCDEVRAQHLLPLQRDPGLRGRVEIREVDMSSEATLRDFTGTLVSHRAFARVHAARIAPTVVAFDGRGARRGKPIVGAKIPEFYGHYLKELLERALEPQGLR